MGCDIYMCIERRVNGEWETLPITYSGRNYDLFAILANVRNGRGDTGDGFVPISEPRGFPDDFEYDEGRSFREDGDDYPWMGDHSFSWVSLKELVEYDWSQVTKRRGWLTARALWRLETFKEWDEFEQPKGWCAGMSGGKVQHRDARDPQVLAQVMTVAQQIHPNGKDGEAFDKAFESVYFLAEWPVMYSIAAGIFIR